MESMQMTFVAMASSIGIAMHNATNNQRNGQHISTASTTICCKLILKTAKGS
jgi:hypothetical protein